MSKRDFGSIKSILHFDFPYSKEPNDGLGDEASSESWKIVGNTSLAGTQIPYATNSDPKFGYRCAYFPNTSSYITGTNKNETFNILKSGNYEIEAFIKFQGTGNIFNFRSALYDYFNGHTFSYFPFPMTWHEAKSYCESLGGHLATSTSAEKNTFLANITGGLSAWLGGTDEEQEGVWKWITGEEWDYTNWASSQPDNYNNNEHYLHINYNAAGNWNDTSSNAELTAIYGFICEWDEEITLDNKNLLLTAQSDGTLALSEICDEVTSSTALTQNTWQHILLRISEGYCTLYLNGIQVLGTEISSDIIPLEVQLGGFTGYMDEFVFRNSAGSGTPKIPAAPYTATFDVGLVGGFGSGSDGDVTISENSQINSYGLINSITDPKTFEVNSWNNGMYSGYSYFNGHAFKYFSNTMTWQEAKTYCEMLGGHLATSISEEKNNFLVSLTGNKNIWLGGTDENSEGNWEWVTGEEWDYSNWYSGQPDNASNNQHYLMLNYSSKQWYDYKNTSTYGFVCEWDYEIDMSGRELMLHITAPTSTTSGYYPNVGLYAFSKIASIDGNNVVLEDDITTENGFDFTLDSDLLSTYYVQAITVPHFKTFTINSGATVTPLSWNTTTGGGIVAFRCKADCTINGNITTHGRGAVRYDTEQMENSKLIDRFLCAQGGGIFATCGGTFTTSESARLGATWSGEGDGSNGATGYGGNSGSVSDMSSANYTAGASGGVGGGAGGSVFSKISGYTYLQGGNVGQNGKDYVAASTDTTGMCCSGGGGCGGNGGKYTRTSISNSSAASSVTLCTCGSGGGGAKYTGGKGGASISLTYRNKTYSTLTGADANGVNGGECITNTTSTNIGYRTTGGGGGGAPGDNGGSGGIAGACIILLVKTLSATKNSLSTGGASSSTVQVGNSYYGASGGGGGTGFCYISAERLK